MKINHFKFAGVLALLLMPSLNGAAPPVMRDVATQEQLVLTLRKAGQTDPMKRMTPAKGPDPSVVNRPGDLLAESDIISAGGLATLVPKRAILQTPEKYAAQIKLQPGAKIVSWADFYAANRGWITTVEVSRVQAEGNKPIAEDTRKFMGTCRNLIVATYQGGPISILPLKIPEKDATAKTTTPNSSRLP